MKKYEEYLEEKIGGFDVTREEFPQIIKQIIRAVKKNKKLRDFIKPETLDSGDTDKIIKELFGSNPQKVLELVMNTEEMWEYDTADVQKLVDDYIRHL